MSKPVIIDLLNNSGRTRRTGTVDAIAAAGLVNNWDPFAGADAGKGVVLTAVFAQGSFITGMASAAAAIDDVVTIVNNQPSGPGSWLTFFDNDPASLAGNRFVLPDGLPLILQPGQAVSFICRNIGPTKYWRCIECTTTTRDLVHCLPPPSLFLPQTSYDPVGYFWVDEDLGAMRDSVANANLAAVNGACLYAYYIEAFKGINVNAAARGFAANQYAPGLASQAIVGCFSMPAHNAVPIGLWGYNDPGSSKFIAFVNSGDDHVVIRLTDVGAAHTADVNIPLALTFGHRYCLVMHINRTTNLLYARLVDMDTGAAANGVPADISAFLTITGAGAPLFEVGSITGLLDGTTITQHGIGVITAGVEGADVAANLTKRLTGT